MSTKKTITYFALAVIAVAVAAIIAHLFPVAPEVSMLGLFGLAGTQYWSEGNHIVKGLDPVADGFSGATVYSDVVSMKRYRACTFLLIKGVGTTGTSTVTVQACDDFVPTNRTPVPFRYRRCCNTGDVQGPLLAATAAGFATTAGSSEIYEIEVLAEDLAATGYPNVQLKCAELVDDPVLGGIVIILSDGAAQAIAPTVIA